MKTRLLTKTEHRGGVFLLASWHLCGFEANAVRCGNFVAWWPTWERVCRVQITCLLVVLWCNFCRDKPLTHACKHTQGLVCRVHENTNINWRLKCACQLHASYKQHKSWILHVWAGPWRNSQQLVKMKVNWMKLRERSEQCWRELVWRPSLLLLPYWWNIFLMEREEFGVLTKVHWSNPSLEIATTFIKASFRLQASTGCCEY